MSITIIGGCILIGLGLINEPLGTIKYVTLIITIRGVAWICTKITSINKEASEIINMTGWCAAVIPLVGLIKLAVLGVTEFAADMQTVGGALDKLVAWIDKITFWN